MTINLYMECSKIACQIPEGMVSTYGAIAKALGDDRAKRAVGVIMNTYDSSTPMPCHRVVYSDGGIGGFAYGIEAKIKRLAPEGVTVKDDRIINFDDLYFTDFKTPDPKPLEQAREEQLRLAEKVELKDVKPLPNLVLGLDVAYSRRTAFGAGVLYDIRNKEPIDVIKATGEVKFPYVPTYLSYREMSILEKIIKRIDKPAILMFDGNGVLHQFGIGIASHVGVHLEMPSMGVAKKQLCGELLHIPTNVGDSAPVTLKGKTIGYALKTSKRANPVLVSPGHLMSMRTVVKLAKNLSKSKLPEPLRLAHQEATKMRGLHT